MADCASWLGLHASSLNLTSKQWTEDSLIELLCFPCSGRHPHGEELEALFEVRSASARMLSLACMLQIGILASQTHHTPFPLLRS